MSAASKLREKIQCAEQAAFNRAANRDNGGFTVPMTVIDARRATLPSMPCGRCGVRGWCKHRPEPA